MWKRIPFCDICGKQIPMETKKDIFGQEIEVAKVGKINPFCNEYQMPMGHLMTCECCADKINALLIKFKYETLMEELK